MDPRTIAMPPRTTHSMVPLGVHVGVRLGPYQPCVELGSGGMGQVYLARVAGPRGVPHYVALKCLRPHCSGDPRLVAMFVDEARVSMQIQHPNVCRVLDYEEHAAVPYMALEYLVGETLASLRRELAKHELAPERRAAVSAYILAEAAEGLHAAHELVDDDGKPLGVVHRDVSPDNIFVTYDGAVKVMDFGVAAGSHQRQRTQSGVVKGKLAYLQPEVLRGGKPDRRADVWGMGVVLWELLTGARLFERETDIETLQAIAEAEIKPPSSVYANLPAAFDAVVIGALQRDPANRPASARAFGRQLIALLADHKLACGRADIAELMDELFPSGRACKRQLMQVVEKMDDDLAPRGVPDEHAVTRVGRAELLDIVDSAPHAAPAAPVALASAASPCTAGSGSPHVKRAMTDVFGSPLRTIAVALIAALAVGLGACAVAMLERSPRARAATGEPAPAPVAPTVAPAAPAAPDTAYRLEVTPIAGDHSDDSDAITVRIRVLPK